MADQKTSEQPLPMFLEYFLLDAHNCRKISAMLKKGYIPLGAPFGAPGGNTYQAIVFPNPKLTMNLGLSGMMQLSPQCQAPGQPCVDPSKQV